MSLRYYVARPDEYLAVTGNGIESVKIAKSAFVWPFQRVERFSIQPQDYALSLQAMTKEKLQFLLPVVFTVGPDANQRGSNISDSTKKDKGRARHIESNENSDLITEEAATEGDALMKYVMLLAQADKKEKNRENHIHQIITGIIEGETRVIVSSMSMEEIFTEREQFKKKIFHNIQGELDQFGLKIYNANVKELRDAPDSAYFESLSRKAHEGAINQARIDVAEAQKKGNVGEAQRHGEQNRDIAKIQAETAVSKTERDSEKAKAEAVLATRKTEYTRDVNIAQIMATRATETRDEELRKEVEMKRAQTELERLRASDVVKATILRESKQQAADAKNYEEKTRADAEAYSEQKGADARTYKEQARANAEAYSEQKGAEARTCKEQARTNAEAYNEQKSADARAYKIRVEAEARFLAASKDAEAGLLRQQKEAEGMTAMAGAYAKMASALGGPQGLLQYLMIEKGTFTSLANANAAAVRGLNPKMTIWNTGAQAGGNGTVEGGSSSMGGMDSIRNMYQMLPPLMSTIHEQTGMTLPEWQYGKLGAPPADEPKVNEVNGKGKGIGHVNGNGH